MSPEELLQMMERGLHERHDKIKQAADKLMNDAKALTELLGAKTFTIMNDQGFSLELNFCDCPVCTARRDGQLEEFSGTVVKDRKPLH